MAEKKTKTEELLEKISKAEEVLEKISKNLEDTNKGIETNKESEVASYTGDSRTSEPKVNEIKPSKTKSKKMVRRSVAVALGIICIILVASLGAVVFMAYSPTSGSSVTSLQNQINDLNATLYSVLNTRHHSDYDYNELQSELNAANSSWNIVLSEYNSLQSTYNNYVRDHSHTDEDYNNVSSQNTNLTSIVSLANYTIWVNDQTISQPAGSYTSWIEYAGYAGYVSVHVQNSSVAGTHVRVVYSTFELKFDQEIVVSVGGTAVFPILPSGITVFIGNGNQGSQGEATETVYITYYY